jgi:tRNA 2-selenouridine synthase
LYSAIIDFRGKDKFVLDHIPGAVCADSIDIVLSELVNISNSGTTARPSGQAKQFLADLGQDPYILVYGDDRNDVPPAYVKALRHFDLHVEVLYGGYQGYRRWVQGAITKVAGKFSFRVICGEAGSGKTTLLAAMKAEGCQTLEPARIAMEIIADGYAVTQEMFESRLLFQFNHMLEDQPVWAEFSHHVWDDLKIPSPIGDAICHPEMACQISVSIAERVRYWTSCNNRASVAHQSMLDWIEARSFQISADVIHSLRAKADKFNVSEMVEELLREHFDKAYSLAMQNISPSQYMMINLDKIECDHIQRAAKALLDAAAS